MSKQATFSLLGQKHLLTSDDAGYRVDERPLAHVMKRRDNFSIAFTSLLTAKGLQALDAMPTVRPDLLRALLMVKGFQVLMLEGSSEPSAA